MADPNTAAPSGVLGPLRSLLSSALALAQTYIELAGVEVREEKERLRQAVVLVILAAIGLATGLLMLSALVVVLFWDSHRLLVLALLTLVYFAIGIGAIAILRRRLADQPQPFGATVAELEKDRQRLTRLP